MMGFVWSQEDEMVRGSDEAWTVLAAVFMPHIRHDS